MIVEGQNVEFKSLKKAYGPKADLKALADTCVCLANAQGGTIFIGIEEDHNAPPHDQKIDQETINDVLSRLRSLTSSVGLVNPQVIKHGNGGEYFSFTVLASSHTIATTSSGKVFIRITDKCYPVNGEELTRIAAEKNAFQWELVVNRAVRTSDVAVHKMKSLADELRKSDRVRPHVKQLDDLEIVNHYNLADGEYLTNLGVLWLSEARERSRLAYPITVQYIVYDELDNKVRKEDWHDYMLNPMELLLDIESKAVELKYFYEFPQGLFRKRIHHYAPAVIRELLINAIAHKSFTISGDIFVEVYPDRVEITNPGSLPLGITKDNILHRKHRRNPHLIRMLHDLKLMEGEGSGYDLIYEIDSRDAKPFPTVTSEYDFTKVTQASKIMDEESVFLIEYIAEHFSLSQKEFIVLGILTREKKILPTQLSKLLQLTEEDRLRSYVGRLVEQGILVTRGIRKGTEYLISPKLIEVSKLNIKPTLKTIERHRLKALVEEDLIMHPDSTMEEIHSRIPDVELTDLRKVVYKMTEENILLHSPSKTYRRYSVAKKNRNEIETK